MRQQLANLTNPVRRQALAHIEQVQPIELCRLNQAHDGARTLACQQPAPKQPVLASNRNGAHLALDPVVVVGQSAIVDEPRERLPRYAAAAGVQLEELAPGMRHAAHLCDAVGKAGLVAPIVVAHQAARPLAQEARACSPLLLCAKS